MKNSKGAFAVIHHSNNSVILESAQNFDHGLPDIEQSKRNQKAIKHHQRDRGANSKNFKFHNNDGNNLLNFDDHQFQDPLPEEEGFLKSILSQNLDEDDFENFGSQMMIIGGGADDLNKIHKNFAGDTFSQISSTYEQQQQQLPAQNANLNQQQSQNEMKSKHSKLYPYQEKNVSKHKQQNNDELLDSAILNNLNEDMNSPKDNNNYINIKSNANQIIDFKFFNNGAFPSPHSNFNNIIMNSEQLQQSDMQSTNTIYNSGIFDDASIMRILDKSISDDSLFFLQMPDDIGGKHQQQSQMRNGLEMEQSFKFECEDVKQILGNVSTKLKEKLQKQSRQSSSQLIAIQIEELKQYEIMATSAIEKIRQIQTIGKQILDQQKVRSLTMKNYKQNLKIQLHNQIQKFKEVCKKQYQQAERQKFKYQINEFDLNDKIKQMEERLERQGEEINKLANRNEQLKFEKKVIAQKNDQKLTDIERILKVVIKTMSAKENERLSKINNSFCLGTDHSMLLQPKQRIQIVKQQNLDIQQSVDEKENESILSNKLPLRINQKELRGYLDQMKRLVKENKKLNQQFKEDQQQQQEGGSCFESSSILNLMGELNDQKRDSLIQQSQFIPQSSQADMNRAFIQSQNTSQSSNFNKNGKFINIVEDLDENDQSLDYKFNEDHILVVMDGVNNHKISDQSKGSLMYLDDRISTKDLAGQQKEGITYSQRMIQEQKREQIMVNPNNNKYAEKFLNISNENSIDDDLNILQNLSKQGNDIFPGDLSGIGNDFKNSVQGGINFGGTGRNIFIVDEFTGGSIDFNSRNDEKLYSGGSSQLSMMQAFQSLRGIQQSKELIVVKVHDRQITMPKLNLRRICDQGEPFKHNLNNVSCTSSSCSESLPIQSSKSQIKQMVSQPNITSFQNESISKNYQDMVDNGGIEDLLDKAVYIDANNNSKVNNSAGSNKECSVGFNMFDSFKKELGMVDKPAQNNQTKSSEKKQQLKVTNKPTLDEKLFDDNEDIQFNLDFQQELLKIGNKKQEESKHYEDKSIDLSINISRFKKSQSDPNLIFNDVDSDEDEFQRNKDTQDSKNCKYEEIKQQHINQKQFDFKKLKTPQAFQNKIKISIASSNPPNEVQANKPQEKQGNIRKSLVQFKAGIRSSSGNSRQIQEQVEGPENAAQTTVPKMQTKLKIQKLNIVKQQDISHLVHKEEDQSMLVHKQQNPNMSVQRIRNEGSPDIQSKPEHIKKIQRIIKHPRRDVTIVEDPTLSKEVSSDTNNSQSKPQLMQNYMVSAAAMTGSNVHKPSGIKLTNKNRQPIFGTRNSLGFNSNFSNPDIVDSHYVDQSSQPQVIKIKDSSMMQQMKEYQESQDLNANQGITRKAKRVVKAESKSREDEEEKDHIAALSPNRNSQRTSQSHTPQKKNIIIVNKQVIKANPKVIKLQAQSEVHNYEDNPAPKLVPSTISMKKISISKKRLNNFQNVSVINQSIDQSQLQGVHMIQNESIMIPSHIENSFMINDVSQIQPRSGGGGLQGKIIKQKIKKISNEHTQPSSDQLPSTNATPNINIANKNIQSLLQNGQAHIKSLNKHLIQKFKNSQLQHKIDSSNYNSNQSQQQQQHQQPQNEARGFNDQQQPLDYEKNYYSQPQQQQQLPTEVKRVEENKIQKRRRDLLLKATNQN